MSDPITYRRFTDDDIPAAHALTVELKWPHRADDWKFVAHLGIGFVAQDTSGVIGTALCWKFGADRASLGMVIVSPAHQGRGIGRQLMERVLEALGGRVTFLHATTAGRPLYEKLGFHATGTLDQHQGAAFQPPLVSLPPGERLRPLGSSDTARLVELASRASGLDRSVVLPALLTAADGIALDRDGELVGFALFRRFGRGFAIGPVVAPAAPDERRAKALISHWLALNEGVFVRIDTPGGSGLTAWLERMGLPRVDTSVKMVRPAQRGDVSDAEDDDCRQFGIVNQAIF
ncbi:MULTISPECIES: GNAT family N-acetyltransferase [Paraburkholderia]|uniref:GNAT family N-acetyltransferase n=1 Tax=Paraburkholderia TaxID=1822464 RepID=UPI002254181E|nr:MULTISPECIES: GNAT family N-acetyltransferase [Paraburkholderia]MCX4163857.1 GNAT family N-acetyltransferase [Paraburkholderia megapolitana]MDN7159352.1 GNAT family N-acetyltransferase [Paraburkholderia sp. CHISQ3]MDQ6496399.1 GNAT family N-acetyltransferase [Paraburkholderia megapolitana]